MIIAIFRWFFCVGGASFPHQYLLGRDVIRSGLAILLGAFALLAAVPVFAGEDYYVELGGDVSREDGQKQWDALVAANKKWLSPLHYFPKAVIESGSAVNVRIQAGPIDSKDKAQKICTRLFKQNIACFVMEGFGGKPPSSIASLAEQSMNAPVKMIQFPWLMGADEPPPVRELPVAGEGKAEVEVARAIHVPLTESEQPQNAHVVVTALPDIEVDKNAPYPDESTDSGPGWLVVAAFPDEDVANAFWEEARATAPKQAKKLHASTLKPLAAAHEKSTTTLNIGSFASSSDAYKFCRERLQAGDRGLTCSFSNARPGGESSEHGEAYARRRPVQNPPAQ